MQFCNLAQLQRVWYVSSKNMAKNYLHPKNKANGLPLTCLSCLLQILTNFKRLYLAPKNLYVTVVTSFASCRKPENGGVEIQSKCNRKILKCVTRKVYKIYKILCRLWALTNKHIRRTNCQFLWINALYDTFALHELIWYIFKALRPVNMVLFFWGCI